MNVLLIHGSSDERHAQAAAELAEKVAAQLGEQVGIAGLGERLPVGATVMPLFLSRGQHLGRDVPAMLAACNGRLVAGPYRDPEAVAAMIADLAAKGRGACRAVVLAVYRMLGNKDLVAALYRQSKAFPLPAVAGLHGSCNMRAVLKLWRQEGIAEACIQPALLFPGNSLGELNSVADMAGMRVRVGEPLSAHPGFPDWIANRFREAA